MLSTRKRKEEKESHLVWINSFSTHCARIDQSRYHQLNVDDDDDDVPRQYPRTRITVDICVLGKKKISNIRRDKRQNLIKKKRFI